MTLSRLLFASGSQLGLNSHYGTDHDWRLTGWRFPTRPRCAAPPRLATASVRFCGVRNITGDHDFALATNIRQVVAQVPVREQSGEIGASKLSRLTHDAPSSRSGSASRAP